MLPLRVAEGLAEAVTVSDGAAEVDVDGVDVPVLAAPNDLEAVAVEDREGDLE